MLSNKNEKSFNPPEEELESTIEKGPSNELASMDIQIENALEAVKRDPKNFKLLSDQLRNTREILLAAMEQDVMMLKFAGYDLQRDDDILLKASSSPNFIVEDCDLPGEAFLNLDFSFSIMKKHPHCYINDMISDVVLDLNANYNNRYHSNYNLCKDRSLLKPIEDNIKRASSVYCLYPLDPFYKIDDLDAVLRAIKSFPHALIFASDRLKDDRQVVLTAVKEDGRLLQFAGENMKNDRYVVLTAIETSPYALRFASPGLQNDREIIVAATKSFNALHPSKPVKSKEDFIKDLHFCDREWHTENHLNYISTSYPWTIEDELWEIEEHENKRTIEDDWRIEEDDRDENESVWGIIEENNRQEQTNNS